MAIKYDDWKYANSRLAGTYIFDNGAVVWVKGVMDSGNAVIKKLDGDGDLYKKHYRDLDLTPIRLGYVNIPKSCLFVSRVPKRRDYRQGLSENTIRVSSLVNLALDSFKFHWLQQPATNSYPKFSACMKSMIEGTRASQAFSRDFCLRKYNGHIFIDYQGRETIGEVINGVPTLLEEFNYLKERLSQHVN